MLNPDIITDDFARKYTGTYVRWQQEETSPKEVVVVDSVEAKEDGYPTIKLSHPKYKNLIINYDSISSLDFEWPPTGYFNHKNQAFLFSRVISRQWKKGISNLNAQIIAPYETTGRVWFQCKKTFFAGNKQISFESLESVYKNLFCSFDRAIEQLKQNETLSIALSPWLALGLNTGMSFNTLILWFRQTPIGYYIINEKKIFVFIDAFKQEVRDYIVRNNVRVEIV